MTNYVVPKFPYVVWDGSNISAVQSLFPTAYVNTDGHLWIDAGVAKFPVATQAGVYLVFKGDVYSPDTYTDEPSLLLQFSYFIG